MQQVTNGLFIGANMAAKNYNDLKLNRITHIVSLNGATPWFPRSGIHDFVYLVLDLDDDETEDIYQHFNQLNLFIDRAISSGGAVLVHCTAGISRSSTAVASYLMFKEKLSLDEALAKIRRARPCIRPNSGFMAQLRKYEEFLRAQREEAKTNAKKKKCELCELEKRTEWFETHPKYTILECETCPDKNVMIVWREHTMELTQEIRETMTKALTKVANEKLGIGKWWIDTVQRAIPDHLHWHARYNRGFFPSPRL